MSKIKEMYFYHFKQTFANYNPNDLKNIINDIVDNFSGETGIELSIILQNKYNLTCNFETIEFLDALNFYVLKFMEEKNV